MRVVSFTLWSLYLFGQNSGTHWIGGWLDPKAGLDTVEKTKVLFLPKFKPRPCSLSLYRLSYLDFKLYR
jgi:hypothetical protein